MRLGGDALICDMAEVYGIYDIYSFKPSYISTLAQGLGKTSRLKRAIAGVDDLTEDTLIMAYCADKLANLVWMLSDDGAKKVNCPRSILNTLLHIEENSSDGQVIGYDSPEAFEEAMKKYER